LVRAALIGTDAVFMGKSMLTTDSPVKRPVNPPKPAKIAKREGVSAKCQAAVK